jgi:hypothetical protein
VKKLNGKTLGILQCVGRIVMALAVSLAASAAPAAAWAQRPALPEAGGVPHAGHGSAPAQPCGHGTLDLLLHRQFPQWQGPSGKSRGFPTVGEARSFWTYDLSVMPPKNVQVAATCRAVGEHAAVWIGDAVWGKAVDQEDVDALLAALESTTPRTPGSGIVENNTALFGPPPQFAQGDPDLTVLAYDIPGYKGYLFDGFFRPEDLQPFNPSCKGNPMLYCSNELGMVHVDSANIGTDYMHGVVAHEMEHLIHFGADAGEVAWLDESLAELAMVFGGYEDPANLAAFAASPGAALMSDAPVDYGACLLFGAYLHQRLGADVVRQIVESKANGLASIEALLPEGLTFPTLFAQWTAANILDDTSVGNGEFGYDLVDVPPFSMDTLSSPSFEKTFSLPASAGVYLKVKGVQEADTGIEVTLSSTDAGVGMHAVVPSEGVVLPVAANETAVVPPSAATAIQYFVLANPGTSKATAKVASTPVPVDPLPEGAQDADDVVTQEEVTTADGIPAADGFEPSDTPGSGETSADGSEAADAGSDGAAGGDSEAGNAAGSGSGSSGCTLGTTPGRTGLALVFLLLALTLRLRFGKPGRALSR